VGSLPTDTAREEAVVRPYLHYRGRFRCRIHVFFSRAVEAVYCRSHIHRVRRLYRLPQHPQHVLLRLVRQAFDFLLRVVYTFISLSPLRT